MAIEKNINEDDSTWKGITIEELKFRRSVALIRLEMQKDIMTSKYQSLIPSNNSGSNIPLLDKFNAKIGILQYLFMGYKGARAVINGISALKSFKNKFRK